MGVELLAISKARPVRVCRRDEVCEETHFGVGDYPKRLDGRKPGCYLLGKGGKVIGFRAASNLGYYEFRRHLSLLGAGVEMEEIWEHPARYRGQPFVELIDFPDGIGPCIGPKTSAKLYADFAKFARKAKAHFFSRRVIKPKNVLRSKHANPLSKPHLNALSVFHTGQVAGAIKGQVAGGGRRRKWMWETYCNFLRAFKLASDGGFLIFAL